MSHPLDSFSSPVRHWFRQTFGEATPPQIQGWGPIQRGENTLILAPTGSGKTLAAFLWGIDELYRELSDPQSPAGRGVRLLYVSPLKALNNDIERNLRVPLEGIRAAAAQQGQDLPELRVAVRTGDTPSQARAAMLKKPPHILITTPESLYLMLTSPRAREMFRTVRTVIVDEIHTLSGNKRGVHLSLSLERLSHLAEGPVQRIGLSATIRPLEEVARFLGGQEATKDERRKTAESGIRPEPALSAAEESAVRGRPVTIVDAAYDKPLDLRVITAVPDFSSLPGDSIWPAVIPHVLNDVRTHQSTLIFCNNRRLAERTADRLNAQLSADQSEEFPPGSIEALAPRGVPHDRGIFAIGAEGPIRAHHGSMSKEARRKMEEELKAGRLPALVGTSSLELGIDIGAVDLVVQLQSPKSVARGLQRIGRSGHLVGQTSVGRIYTTFREDVVEAAAIARGMLEGDVEATYTPQNPLDVLAQQIVAMVACEDWSASALYALVRQAYPYRLLARSSFDAVLSMLSGKYPNVRARLVWDKVNDRLAALPGSRLLATMNPGTISNTGAYNVVLSDRKTRVGELDEEFVFETRVGDTFLLGSKVWRVLEIEDDRIVVGDAAGQVPRMPFWNGDYPWRPFELGERIGRFRREVAEKIAGPRREPPEQIQAWLKREFALDENSARNLVAHVQRQLDAVGVMSSDRSIVVESFQDAVGEPRLVIHSPFGGRVNGAWALALTSAIRERTGVEPETQSNDDGILFRFAEMHAEPPVDLVRGMTAVEARERILRELPNSALFGAHFRMNAERALLLPKAHGAKRTPFWLQRLKAKDLLAIVRRYDDFPIIAETYRDCLDDVLDLPHLEEILTRIADGEIRVEPIETLVPSPVASGLLFQFVNVYMYEWDAPKAERQLQSLSLHREMLDDLLQGVDLKDLLKPEAIAQTTAQAQHLATGYQARTSEELALVLEELGDLSMDQIIARSAGDGRAWLEQLAHQGRVRENNVETGHGVETRWTLVSAPATEAALDSPRTTEQETEILRRWLRAAGPISRADILDYYAFDERWLDEVLEHWVQAHEIVRGHFTRDDEEEFCDRLLLEQIHHRSLTLLRREIQPVSLHAYADFLVRWQHLHPQERLAGEEGLRQVIQQLRGATMPLATWEREALPARLHDFAPGDLGALAASGELVWVGSGSDKRGHVRLFFRGEGALFLPPPDPNDLSEPARRTYEYLKSEGASFTAELKSAVRESLLRDALVELVMRGLVTNDSLQALGELFEMPRARPGLAASPLQAELAARLPGPRPLTPGRYRDAKRRVAHRMRTQSVRAESRPPAPQGRWSLVHRAGVTGPALSEEERADRLAHVLLARYGVLMRESLEHEEGMASWALLYPVLQRMEMRGQVRRGYFVAGLGGVQFALPDAVERLRQAPDASTSGDQALVVLSAVDPANLFGGELPGVAVRFARVPSTSVVLARGQPILVAQDHGERIATPGDADPGSVRRALEAFLAHPGAPRHVAITQWNGDAVLGGPFQPLLHSLGFFRMHKGMER